MEPFRRSIRTTAARGLKLPADETFRQQISNETILAPSFSRGRDVLVVLAIGRNSDCIGCDRCSHCCSHCYCRRGCQRPWWIFLPSPSSCSFLTGWLGICALLALRQKVRWSERKGSKQDSRLAHAKCAWNFVAPCGGVPRGDCRRETNSGFSNLLRQMHNLWSPV